MFLQLIGAVTIVGAAAALGRHYALREDKRVQDLLSLKKALLILSSEIEYMRTPLPAAAVSIGRRAQGWGGELFTRFGAILEEEGETTAYNAWVKAIDSIFENTHIAAADRAVIDDFGKTLGYLDTKMQMNSIAHTVAYIDEKTAELQAGAEKNRKMYKSLGVIGGLLLAVVLW